MSIYAKVLRFPKCDFCDNIAVYDANVPKMGWANVCSNHFNKYRCSLGTGKGQQLVVPFESLDASAQEVAIRNARKKIAQEEGTCTMNEAELAKYLIDGEQYFFATGEGL
jgi:hypothetical protein